MKQAHKKTRWRQLKASWRDTLLLFREFRSPLILFGLLLIGSGTLYYLLSLETATPVHSLVEAVYLMLNLTFLQAFGEFPQAWYLQVFFFVMPFLGVAILAQGLTEFGVLLFNRRARAKEWEMAVASTYNDHVVLVGLGHLGYRVVMKLHELDEDVVVIEMNPKADLVNAVRRLGIPVIEDDATRDAILEAAGVKRARTILLCTQNDSLNLQMALKARNLNPKIEVVIRIFEDDFAEALQKQFGFRALSATGMAAPVFAASAAQIDISSPISIAGEPNSLARIQVTHGSGLAGQEIAYVEDCYNLSIVMLCHEEQIDVHPASHLQIQADDTIAVLGNPNDINRLVHSNRK